MLRLGRSLYCGQFCRRRVVGGLVQRLCGAHDRFFRRRHHRRAGTPPSITRLTRNGVSPVTLTGGETIVITPGREDLIDAVRVAINHADYSALASDRKIAYTAITTACTVTLGGLKWWSQHSEEGGCDEDPTAAFGSGWSGTIAVTRSATGCRTR